MRALTILLLCFLMAGTAHAQEAGTGWLGVNIKDLTREEADALGWKAPHGAKVVTLVSGGPAEAAGLMPDDILVSLDGVEIENGKALAGILSAKAVGTEIELIILRAEREKRLALKLGARPREAQEKLIENEVDKFSRQQTHALEKIDALEKANSFKKAVFKALDASRPAANLSGRGYVMVRWYRTAVNLRGSRSIAAAAMRRLIRLRFRQFV